MRNPPIYHQSLQNPTQAPLVQALLSTKGLLIGTFYRDPATSLLVVNWSGYCTPEDIQHSVERLLLFAPNCCCALSNSVQSTGDWSDLVPWLAYDFLPRLRAVGVSHLATVPSTADCTSYYAHKQLAEHARQFLTIEIFQDAATARHWLACPVNCLV